MKQIKRLITGYKKLKKNQKQILILLSLFIIGTIAFAFTIYFSLAREKSFKEQKRISNIIGTLSYPLSYINKISNKSSTSSTLTASSRSNQPSNSSSPTSTSQKAGSSISSSSSVSSNDLKSFSSSHFNFKFNYIKDLGNVSSNFLARSSNSLETLTFSANRSTIIFVNPVGTQVGGLSEVEKYSLTTVSGQSFDIVILKDSGTKFFFTATYKISSKGVYLTHSKTGQSKDQTKAYGETIIKSFNFSL